MIEIEWFEVQIDIAASEREVWWRRQANSMRSQFKLKTSIDHIDKKTDLIELYETEIEKRRGYLERVDGLINQLTGTEHEIARLKYIDGLTLKEVADRIGYDYTYVRRLHSQMLQRSYKKDTAPIELSW